MRSGKTKFSIVVPIYYNELNIPTTVPRLQNLEKIIVDCEFEFIFVDDGSQDASYELLLQAKQQDNRIKVVKLSRNFGSMSAIQAGITCATGDCIGIISADLQDPPELFKEMIGFWREGKKVVLANRTDREESFSQKLFANTYYFFLEKLALKGYPKGGFDFVLIDKQVGQEITMIHEKNTNVMSLVYWLGHDRVQIPYVREQRTVGKSRWTLSKKIKLFVDSFVSFSYAPIRFMSMIGFFTALFSFLYGLFIIFNWMFGTIEAQGWTTIIALVTFLLGVIMMMLGIIGEYLWRILDESRGRPAYIIDQIHE